MVAGVAFDIPFEHNLTLDVDYLHIDFPCDPGAQVNHELTVAGIRICPDTDRIFNCFRGSGIQEQVNIVTAAPQANWLELS